MTGGVRLRCWCCSLVLLILLTPQAAPKPQLNRGVSELTCPERCEDSFRPVCGSNTKVYRNECHLRQVSCKNPSVKKVNDGPCVRPASSSSSSSSSTSSGSRSPAPSPCKEECTKIYIPVCASDGKSYNNLCLMELESCTRRQANRKADRITVVHEGLCRDSPASPSSSDRRCQRTCSSTYDPVCGTDGNTYHNKCEMEVATCLDDRVRQRFIGVCDVPDGSSGSRSSSDGLRPSVNLRPESTAPQASVVTPCEKPCNGGFRPVCGSDGTTYGSDCLLENARCSNPTLRKARDGVCPKDCSLECDQREKPVCGNDGNTYKNICFLIVARCKDPSLDVSTTTPEGPCLRHSNVRPQCQLRCTDERKPVCGSDGRTYTNRCHLELATCERQGLVRVSEGPCRS